MAMAMGRSNCTGGMVEPSWRTSGIGSASTARSPKASSLTTFAAIGRASGPRSNAGAFRRPKKGSLRFMTKKLYSLTEEHRAQMKPWM